jgi:serpin B
MEKLKITILVSLCMISSIFLGCIEDSTVNTKNTINADSVDGYDISTANNVFAFDMYSLIKNGDENIFFSPYSIFTTMAICYDGAEGSTKEQLSDACYYPLNKSFLEESSKEMVDTINSNNDYYSLETANALWVRNDYPLNKKFVNNSENYYGGKITNVDFRNEPEESQEIINEWIATKTNGKIRDLISDDMINPEWTDMIITNTLYFKGNWLIKFDVDDTQKEPFYNSSSSEEGTLVDMMYVRKYFSYGESKNAKVVELPYKGKDLSMYIVLPEENNVEDFENKFTLSDYNELKSTMEPGQDVRIWLPKFTFETKTKLSDPLIEMGVVDAFDVENADFSGIFDSQKMPRGYVLKIDDVVHQTFIEVNETGTEAAAATAEDMAYSKPPGEVFDFKADHPFMFFIEDKRTGCILFMGKVENPEYGEMS